MHYWLGLVALGLGWNLLFVAGTTLLSRTVDPVSRHRAQALNDFIVFGSQACASLLAGLAVQQIGWQALNLATLPLLAAMIFAATRLRPATPPSQSHLRTFRVALVSDAWSQQIRSHVERHIGRIDRVFPGDAGPRDCGRAARRRRSHRVRITRW